MNKGSTRPRTLGWTRCYPFSKEAYPSSSSIWFHQRKRRVMHVKCFGSCLPRPLQQTTRRCWPRDAWWIQSRCCSFWIDFWQDLFWLVLQRKDWFPSLVRSVLIFFNMAVHFQKKAHTDGAPVNHSPCWYFFLLFFCQPTIQFSLELLKANEYKLLACRRCKKY